MIRISLWLRQKTRVVYLIPSYFSTKSDTNADFIVPSILPFLYKTTSGAPAFFALYKSLVPLCKQTILYLHNKVHGYHDNNQK